MIFIYPRIEIIHVLECILTSILDSKRKKKEIPIKILSKVAKQQAQWIFFQVLMQIHQKHSTKYNKTIVHL